MGRFAQRRRSGGGPGEAAAAPSLTIVSVTVGPFASALVTFSAPVTLNLAVFPDGAFSGPGGGGSINSVFAAAADQAQVNFAGAVVTTEPWSLTAQPNWVTSPLVFPDSGFVT